MGPSCRTLMNTPEIIRHTILGTWFMREETNSTRLGVVETLQPRKPRWYPGWQGCGSPGNRERVHCRRACVREMDIITLRLFIPGAFPLLAAAAALSSSVAVRGSFREVWLTQVQYITYQ